MATRHRRRSTGRHRLRPRPPRWSTGAGGRVDAPTVAGPSTGRPPGSRPGAWPPTMAVAAVTGDGPHGVGPGSGGRGARAGGVADLRPDGLWRDPDRGPRFRSGSWSVPEIGARTSSTSSGGRPGIGTWRPGPTRSASGSGIGPWPSWAMIEPERGPGSPGAGGTPSATEPRPRPWRWRTGPPGPGRGRGRSGRDPDGGPAADERTCWPRSEVGRWSAAHPAQRLCPGSPVLRHPGPELRWSPGHVRPASPLDGSAGTIALWSSAG